MALVLAQASPDTGRPDVRAIFAEYLQWADAECEAKMGITFDTQAEVERDLRQLSKYLPPDGQLLLARDDGEIVGCVALRRIGPDMAEIKRMYVRPAYRRKGVGRALLAAVMDNARQAGYRTLRLESPPIFTAAHALYRAHGFQDIEPYPETDIPPEFHGNWLFMEAKL